MVLEAMDLLQKYGPGTKKRISDDWLRIPRETFDAGGWDEMVGPENVEWSVVEDADHDTLIESELVSIASFTYPLSPDTLLLDLLTKR